MADKRLVVKITVLTHERAETVLDALEKAGFARRYESKYGPGGDFCNNGMEKESGMIEVVSMSGSFCVNEGSVNSVFSALSDAEEEGVIDFSFNAWVGTEAEYERVKTGLREARGHGI